MGADNYRSDIDGLRAIAVLAVVFYHAGVPGFSGGFVGVDIFFVISGYLITRIIAREIAQGDFSILRFYERRIRRIFPALFVMLLVSCAAALVIHLPSEMEDFAKALVAASLFVSNVLFWQTADYFAGPAHLKPLLHTWSLAVEEQFYIIFPLMLIVIARWGRERWLLWLIPVAIVSLLISVWGVSSKPVAAFYLLPSRFWELMVGALLALGIAPQIHSERLRFATGITGLTLMGGAIVLYSNATAFPGLAALVPCLGAAMVIHAGSGGATFPTRLLGTKPMVFVGLISYSLYLWHWPLLAFARQWSGESLAVMQIAGLLAASFVLAYLSWRYVEQPFRRRQVMEQSPRLFAAAGLATAAALVFGATALTTGGFAARHGGYAPPAVAGLQSLRVGTCFLKEDQAPADWSGVEQCAAGPADAPLVFLWGDSYAAHLAPGLEAEAAGRFRVVQYTAGGCPPVAGLDIAGRPHCRAFNERALELIGSLRPQVVVISARWAVYLPRVVGMNDIGAAIESVRSRGAAFLLVSQSPNFDFAHPYDFVYRKGREQARISFDTVLNAQIAALSPSNVFDPLPVLCDHDTCDVRRNGSFLYFDDGHFSLEGSRIFARAMMPRLIAQVAGAR